MSKLDELKSLVVGKKYPISRWTHNVKIPVMQWAQIVILVRQMLEEQGKK